MSSFGTGNEALGSQSDNEAELYFDSLYPKRIHHKAFDIVKVVSISCENRHAAAVTEN